MSNQTGPLDAREHEQLRARLRRDAARLRDHLAGVAMSRRLRSSTPHPERADTDEDLRAARNALRVRRALDGTLAALRRMADDEYGRCVHCGEPMEARRLRVEPTVTACPDCERPDRDPV
ncbi:TraR/DksA family transcriptional regulator [Stackebrandtia albiflava]|uniref:TraR/DksA family transcriptional regulator n=1 Tax=Stackebrandtia albiflava TaxID=406432 RepID=A0A562VA15_9ACTN|nr:hypothetical protein [Stackebrandtia albiflava]TWJ14712.1 TraR/DksA family transcriptional regulator [Stackebrandtia albiflava]